MDNIDYQIGKRKRKTEENLNNKIEIPQRLIEKRSKKIRLDSNDQKIIDLGTIMHIPQLKEIENYEVNLEDVSEMTQTVSPHEITIPIKILSKE